MSWQSSECYRLIRRLLWFSTIGEEPCPDVGMLMVEPDVDNHGQRVMDIIHIDTILRGAHLIGIYGNSFLPRHFRYSDTLDQFKAFYINKYADHHAHENSFLDTIFHIP
ncbi:hypothetical protein B0H10DRAFT_1816669 [Mycena sp. CBHHK59/15]|nr:hypothetical protein B0H10DRAFT_1816669 [Mycena sp. CBHHK59/15]